MHSIVMGRIAKRVGPKVQKVATERLIANAEAQVATAEAKPGSGVKPPETVESRTALSDAKAIAYRRALIKILDRKKLEKIVCECYPVIRGTIENGFRKLERD